MWRSLLAYLQEAGTKFIATDMPEANQLTLHIMAAMAQYEREAISDRTKKALAAAKARGQPKKGGSGRSAGRGALRQ